MLISIFNGIAIKDRWIIDFQIAVSVHLSRRPHCAGAMALGRGARLASEARGAHAERSAGCKRPPPSSRAWLADPGGLGVVTRALEVVEKDRERPGTGVARDATLLALKGARHAGVSGHVRVLPLASASACAQPVHGHRLPRRRQGRLHGGRVLILALLPPSLAGLLCTERHHFPVSLSCALSDPHSLSRAF